MDHLGFPAVPSPSTSGAVDGQDATITHTRTPQHALSWRLDTSPEIPHTVPASDIIAIFPLHAQYPEDYCLFHVEVRVPADSAKEGGRPAGPAAPNTFFKYTLITRPPEDLIQGFSPTGLSCFQLKLGVSATTRQAAQDAEAKGFKETPPLHIIVSMASGQRHAEAVFHNALKPMLDKMSCNNYQLHVTDSAHSITELGRQVFLPAAQTGVEKFVIMLSGDGGVVDLLNSLVGSEGNAIGSHTSASPSGRRPGYAPTTLAILPLGTGNALANSSGITGDRTLGLSSVLRGVPKPLPLFRVKFEPPATPVIPSSSLPGGDSSPVTYGEPAAVAYGTVVASWALHAALVADSDAPAYRQHGASRFQAAAKENLFPPDGAPTHEYRGRISLKRRGTDSGESDVWQDVPRNKHSYVLATMCSRLEETFTISPASKSLDGVLRVVHLGPEDDSTMTGHDIMGVMQAAYDGGKHVNNPLVGYEEVSAMRIVMEEDDEPDSATGGKARYRRICVDGKIYLCEPGTCITVEALGKEASVIDLVSKQNV